MKVDIRHTRLWGLENKVAPAFDGYQQFTLPLKRIQSMKRAYLDCKIFSTIPRK